jgi:hypothetical protein
MTFWFASDDVLSASDYIIQGGLLVIVFLYPWSLRLKQPGRAFGVPFIACFGWGIWRIVYFDPETENDIPGIGYVIAAFVFSVVAYLLYIIRCAWLRRHQAITPAQSAAGSAIN